MLNINKRHFRRRRRIRALPSDDHIRYSTINRFYSLHQRKRCDCERDEILTESRVFNTHRQPDHQHNKRLQNDRSTIYGR